MVYLILKAGLQMLKEIPKNPLNIILFTAVSGSMVLFSLLAVSFSSVFYIIICGAAGVFVFLLKKLVRKGDAA